MQLYVSGQPDQNHGSAHRDRTDPACHDGGRRPVALEATDGRSGVVFHRAAVCGVKLPSKSGEAPGSSSYHTDEERECRRCDYTKSSVSTYLGSLLWLSA